MWLQFAYSWLFFFTIPAYVLIVAYRLFWYRYPVYRFPLITYLHEHNVTHKGYHRIILTTLRMILLLLLVFFLSRPQWIDENSRITVEGIDIIIALDVSASMECIDDPENPKNRLETAKKEAIRFIDKRHNDPIGVVVFAAETLSRCPLTLDKTILKDIVHSLKIGFINPHGTMLGTGLATAVNRLKDTPAKSKIVILLTDGAPSGQEKISPDIAIQLAQEFGVKVYAIGIGSEQAFIKDHLFGLRAVSAELYNEKLLKEISEKTGGKFFQARNAQELQRIYNIIDSLEKTEHQTDIFHHYYEAFFTFMWIVLLLFFLEIGLRLFVWRGI